MSLRFRLVLDNIPEIIAEYVDDSNIFHESNFTRTRDSFGWTPTLNNSCNFLEIKFHTRKLVCEAALDLFYLFKDRLKKSVQLDKCRIKDRDFIEAES